MSYGWHDLGETPGLPSGAGTSTQPITLPVVTVTAKRKLPSWVWIAGALLAFKAFAARG